MPEVPGTSLICPCGASAMLGTQLADQVRKFVEDWKGVHDKHTEMYAEKANEMVTFGGTRGRPSITRQPEGE